MTRKPSDTSDTFLAGLIVTIFLVLWGGVVATSLEGLNIHTTILEFAAIFGVSVIVAPFVVYALGYISKRIHGYLEREAT